MTIQIYGIIFFTVLPILDISSILTREENQPQCWEGASNHNDFRSTRPTTPIEIFIELSVVFDKSLVESSPTFQYLSDYSFWKTVDRYFSFFNQPKIRIRLIETKTINHDVSFLKNTLLNKDKNEIDAYKALYGFSNFAYRQRSSFYCHDITLLITSMNLCSKVVPRCDLPGVGFYRGVCTIDDATKSFVSVAIANSGTTFYNSVKNVIFAIGQLLGARPDNNATEGYFMTDTANSNDYKIGWSNRSMTAIKDLINSVNRNDSSANPTCLFNNPNPKWKSIYSTRYANLPGEDVHIDEYCRQITGNRDSIACNTGYERCQSLSCSMTGKNCSNVAREPAPEGSWCAEDKRCQLGKCETWEPKSYWNKFLEKTGLAP